MTPVTVDVTRPARSLEVLIRRTGAKECRASRFGRVFRGRGVCHGAREHNDSLQLTLADEGTEAARVIVRCWAGCPPGRIVELAGLGMGDLFARTRGRTTGRDIPLPPRPAPRPARATGKPLSIEEARAAVARIGHRKHSGEWMGRSWVYSSVFGRPALLVVRADGPGPKIVRQFHAAVDGWAWGGPETSVDAPAGGWLLPLYHDDLLWVPDGVPVFVVEGEAKCDELRAIGLQATTLAGGSNPFVVERADLSVLRDLQVEILADHDQAGLDHAIRVAAKIMDDPERQLHVRVLPFPEAFGADYPLGSDVADVIAKLRGEGLEDPEIVECISIAVEHAQAIRVVKGAS